MSQKWLICEYSMELHHITGLKFVTIFSKSCAPLTNIVQKDEPYVHSQTSIHLMEVCDMYGVRNVKPLHYNDVIMGATASQITSLTVVYSTVYSDADQRKYQSSASLAFVRRIHRRPVNSSHKWPITPKMFPFDDVIMKWHANIQTCRCPDITQTHIPKLHQAF